MKKASKASVVFLRTSLVAICLAAAAFFFVLLPILWTQIEDGFTDYGYAIYTVFIATFLVAIPFFYGAFNAWRLLDYTNQGKAFSKRSVKALRNIALSAAAISIIYILALPFFYVWGENDDAPGVILIGLILVGAPMVVSVFAALLQRLIAEAVDLKSENELTV